MVKWEWKSTSKQWNGLHRCQIRQVLLYFHYCKNWYNLQWTWTFPTELLYGKSPLNIWHDPVPTLMTLYMYIWINVKKKSSRCCPALSRSIILVMLNFILNLRLDWCTEVHSTVWHDPDPTLVTWLCWSGSAVWQRDSYTWTGNNNNLDIYW